MLLLILAVFPAVLMATDPPPSLTRADVVIRKAESLLGTPYRYGGLTSTGIDCSGLMMISFAEAGYQLPRVSGAQAALGEKIAAAQLQRGDLVFFRRGSRIGHVGLIVSASADSVRFIHASRSEGVAFGTLSNRYWKSRFHSARRIWDALPASPISPEQLAVLEALNAAADSLPEAAEAPEFPEVPVDPIEYEGLAHLRSICPPPLAADEVEVCYAACGQELAWAGPHTRFPLALAHPSAKKL
jgi:hypothetical protein